MAPHADVLDRPEPMRLQFWTSVGLHVLLFGGLTLSAKLGGRIQMGSPTGGGIGGVMVSPVSTIPLPNRGGQANPVASDTKSQIPTPAAPKEKAVAKKEKLPPPNAIPLHTEKASPRRPQPAQQSTLPTQAADNQLTSTVGQRLSSSNFALPGGGTGKIGDNTPFGEQFGWYGKIIRDNIENAWRPTITRTNGRFVVISFTIRRDGSVANVQIAQPSGIPAFDYSAQRAVQDAKLPALPSNFPRSEVHVEETFELGS